MSEQVDTCVSIFIFIQICNPTSPHAIHVNLFKNQFEKKIARLLPMYGLFLGMINLKTSGVGKQLMVCVPFNQLSKRSQHAVTLRKAYKYKICISLPYTHAHGSMYVCMYVYMYMYMHVH